MNTFNFVRLYLQINNLLVLVVNKDGTRFLSLFRYIINACQTVCRFAVFRKCVSTPRISVRAFLLAATNREGCCKRLNVNENIVLLLHLSKSISALFFFPQRISSSCRFPSYNISFISPTAAIVYTHYCTLQSESSNRYVIRLAASAFLVECAPMNGGNCKVKNF